MFKRLGLILLIAGTIAAIYFGGTHIYSKQIKSTNFTSFNILNSSKSLYIPNADIFLTTNNIHEQLTKHSLPSSIYDILSLLSELENFNNTISKEIYLSYDSVNFSLVLKNEFLTAETIQKYLNNKNGNELQIKNSSIIVNNKEFQFKKTSPFFIISSGPITTNKTSPLQISKGNYIYSTNTNSQSTYYTLSKSIISSFCLDTLKKIQGSPISPNGYFKITPSNFDDFNFYGSTAPNKDINTLTNTKDSSDFFNWISHSFVHVRKDSLEIIIGYQNDYLSLRDELDEQTIRLSVDSILPTPLYKNNYEINIFKSNYKWSSILPNSYGKFNTYTELNNYNIIGNSVAAINWFINANQLGSTFISKAKNLNIPSKTHLLTINNHKDTLNILTKNWISNKKCIISRSSPQPSESNTQDINQFKNFKVNGQPKHLNSFVNNDSIFIITSNNEKLRCYHITGKIMWSKSLNSPLIKKPETITLKNNKKGFVIFSENNIDVITHNGKSLSGFPYKLSNSCKKGIVIQYENNGPYRILIALANEILNIDLSGNIVIGWTNPKSISPIKSNIYYNLINGKDYIYYKDLNDSIHIIDRQGNHRFEKNFFSKTINESQFISGNSNGLRILNYKNSYINSVFISNSQKDSLLIKVDITPNNVFWTKTKQKLQLVLEDHQQLNFYSEFGFIEKQIQKPQFNLTYLNKHENNRNLYVFGNLTKNELYLLNNFGKQINKKPILGGNIFTVINNYFIVYHNAQIWVYAYK